MINKQQVKKITNSQTSGQAITYAQTLYQSQNITLGQITPTRTKKQAQTTNNTTHHIHQKQQHKQIKRIQNKTNNTANNHTFQNDSPVAWSLSDQKQKRNKKT